MEGDELNALAQEQAENTAPEPEAAEQETPSEEASEPAEEGATPEGEEAPPEEAPEPVDALPDALVELDGGEKVSVAELQKRWKDSGMMQADYTRKTQQVAEDRRKLEAEQAEFDGTKAELKTWLQSMHDPDMLEAQCLELFPDAFEAAVERRAQEKLQLRDADERTKDLITRERRLRVETATGKSQTARTQAVEETSRAKQAAEQNETKVAELRTQFLKWNDTAMQAAGLDVNDPDVRQLVVGAVRATLKSNEDITEQHFKDAVAKVAKLSGAKPPASKPAQKPKQAALPPSTSGKTSAAPARTNGTPKSAPQKKVPMADFMARISRGEF